MGTFDTLRIWAWELIQVGKCISPVALATFVLR
jgi:hypothetical protein